MSFYTALTGLKGAQTDISTTSNNIANVGSNGFKKSRAEFGDIYGSTPLQAKSVGVGTMTKSITQQFSQGNLATSSNTLDMAISGQGFLLCRRVEMHRRPSTREMALLMSTTAVTLLIATVNFFWAILWIMMALFLIKPCRVPINLNLMPPTANQKKLLALKWA